MKCPACSRDLKQVNIADVIVDICENGCGGIWFDQFEIDKFDEPHETDGGILLNINRDPNVIVDNNKNRKCPRCTSFDLRKHFFSIKQEVEVDECFNCAGFWLDHGELLQIREQFKTEDNRTTETDEYFDSLVNEKWAPIYAKNEEKYRRAKKIANIFLFFGRG